MVQPGKVQTHPYTLPKSALDAEESRLRRKKRKLKVAEATPAVKRVSKDWK